MEDFHKYVNQFPESSINLYSKDRELKEKFVDNLVAGFSTNIDFQKQSTSYENDTFGTAFELHRSKNFPYNLYFVDMYPFGLSQDTPPEKKRCAKILILLWYLSLIRNFNKIFPTPNLLSQVFQLTPQIGNVTNAQNNGFMKKIFGPKIRPYKNIDSKYSFQFKCGDLLATEARIKQLLQEYLFKETNFCGNEVPITDSELKLINLHCERAETV